MTDGDELVNSMATDDEHRELLRRIGVGSGIIVPMTVAGKVIGALRFINGEASRRFDETDLELATEIARRAGLAVENARLSTEHAHVARTLQMGLMPRALPLIPGWEAAAMYQPAGEVNQVGGDFYDAFEYDGGWMIVLGDIVGRGATAASLTALSRYTIRTAGELTGDPRIALRTLDAALREQTDSLCSAVIVVLPDASAAVDPAPVMIVSAGHPPPLLVRAGEAQELELEGPMLGAVDDPEWHPEHLELRSGDQLILYTDGIIEARGPDGRFGAARLKSRLEGNLDPGSTLARLEVALEAFVAGPPEDDAAAIVLQRRPGSPTLAGAPMVEGERIG
jgi:serine phosphatase RsbU (regulator of sigma subunit)